MSGTVRAGSRPATVDIALIADIRVGDVAAPCHAAAAEALCAAGYSVAVVPLFTDAIAADPYRLDPDMDRLLRAGTVRRIAPGAALSCTLALAFDARLFAAELHRLPRITAQHRVVTVERPAALAGLDRVELARLQERADIAMGGPVIWCPTSTIARDAMAFAVPHWPVTGEDWAPVAPDLSHVRADAADRSRPVVGRARIAQTRPNSDWPARFLSTPLVGLRMRGATGSAPPIWPHAAPLEQWSEDAIAMDDFLAKLDLLANPDLAEDDPMPVEALMAISAGVIPCLPETYREVFGAAAVYGTDGELVQAVIDLKLRPYLMTAARESGAALLREVFAPDIFVNRIKALIGPAQDAPFAPAVHAEPPARVLFYSSNGIGMGHLTRQLSVARRLPERLQPVFVSHSRAVDTVRGFGFVGEHLPYHTTYGAAKAHWNTGLAATLEAAFDFYRPEVALFDGNVPFLGFMAALSERRGIASVWIRRAMWGAGRDTEALDRGDAFDVVVEPLDPAWSRDTGPTVARQSQARLVPPVRILDTAERLSRADACAALGLNPEDTNALVATGSGNNFDTAGITSRVMDRLQGRTGLGLALAEWQIAQTRLDVPDSVARVTGYPFAQYHAAFDLAVAAPGYNTFCEHLAAALPTLWVPNENAQMDRQIDRARWAVQRGCGSMVRRAAPFDVADAMEAILDPKLRADMAAAGTRVAAQYMAQNGAGDIARIVADLAGSSIARMPLTDAPPEEVEAMEQVANTGPEPDAAPLPA